MKNESHRNWTEDYALENGKYFNACAKCGFEFIGHKRRVTCKVCYNNKPMNITDHDKRRAEEYRKNSPNKMAIEEQAYLAACSEKNEEMEWEACGFAEWVSGQGWSYDNASKKWLKRRDVPYGISYDLKTTAELYTLYKQQKQ